MNTDPYPTKFSEANALLAVQSGDPDLAADKLQNFMPTELYALRDACDVLAVLCREELTRRGLRGR
jgi:hypothetical protein